MLTDVGGTLGQDELATNVSDTHLCPKQPNRRRGNMTLGTLGRRLRGACLGAWVLALLLLSLPDAGATVVQRLEITSVPAGAQVSLYRGSREVPIGKTPFTYEASFHSQISVLRLVFRKTGYEGKIVKIKADDRHVIAELKGVELASEPSAHRDPQLRGIQRRLNPTIERTLLGLLQRVQGVDLDLAGKATVERLGGRIYLVVPLLLRNREGRVKKQREARGKEFVASAWRELGSDVVIPLAKKLKKQRDLHGLVLDIYLDERRFHFNVSSRVESHIEMKCVPGYVMRNVYDACAKRRIEYSTDSSGFSESRDAGCQGGMMMKSVYDPCASRMPATKSQVVVDPTAEVVRGKGRARFALPLSLVSGRAVPFEEVALVLQDAGGRTRFSQGEIPWEQ